MDVLVAVLLGILQGVTEWLPISSSGHLVIFQHFLGVDEPIFFDAVVHLGTATSAIIYTRKRLLSILKEGMRAIRDPHAIEERASLRLAYHTIIATIPIVIVALLLRPTVEDLYHSMAVVSAALPITGLILYTTRHLKGKRSETTRRSALAIGISQCLALIPGISRAGITISAGLHAGLERRKAVEFSFLLSIPALIGAGILQIHTALATDMNVDIYASLIGYIVSAVVGYLTLKALVRIVISDRFHEFSFYCVTAGAVLWFYLAVL